MRSSSGGARPWLTGNSNPPNQVRTQSSNQPNSIIGSNNVNQLSTNNNTMNPVSTYVPSSYGMGFGGYGYSPYGFGSNMLGFPSNSTIQSPFQWLYSIHHFIASLAQLSDAVGMNTNALSCLFDVFSRNVNQLIGFVKEMKEPIMFVKGSAEYSEALKERRKKIFLIKWVLSIVVGFVIYKLLRHFVSSA